AARCFSTGKYKRAVFIYSSLIRSLDSASFDLVSVRRHYGLSDTPVVGMLVHPRLLGALDERAASYMKLEQPQLAKKDARRMLEIDSTSCKGYLRLGKLYIKEGRVTDAYRVYRTGVFNIERARERFGVEVPERLFSQLREQYETVGRLSKAGRSESADLSARTKKRGLQLRLDDLFAVKRSKKVVPNTADPFQNLPLEIVERVFHHVPTNSVFRCRLVCRRWYSVLTSMSQLFSTFALKNRVTHAQFVAGLKFMKKVQEYRKTSSVRLLHVGSTQDQNQLELIVHSIVAEETVRFGKLEIVNRNLSLPLLLQAALKTSFCSPGLVSVTHVKLGFSSFPYNIRTVLALFPNAEKTELVGLDYVNSYAQCAVLLTSPEFETFQTAAKRVAAHEKLRSVLISNNPALLHDEQIPTAFPPLLSAPCPNLEELQLVGFRIGEQSEELKIWLRNAPKLTRLFLEDYFSCNLCELCKLLQILNPETRLHSLTLRENTRVRRDFTPTWPNYTPSLYPCFQSLVELDLYGCAVSAEGLLTVLHITNANASLQTLNLGNLVHVPFRTDMNAFARGTLDFASVFRAVPNLRCFILADSDLDNFSMRVMAEDLRRIYGCAWHLDTLDLSFCRRIDGVGIMSLFSLQPLPDSVPRIDTLVLDGLDVSENTLAYLQSKSYVGEIRHDAQRKKWRRYGVNSFV
ncbi:hypothetical protein METBISCDRAFT_4822, partial [Metschnikowia bicuspidata]